MRIRKRLREAWNAVGGERRADGLSELAVGDPAYDEWDVVRDFEELETARAFRQALGERGMRAILTADRPLDRFGRGDIALRAPSGLGLEAEALLDEPD